MANVTNAILAIKIDDVVRTMTIRHGGGVFNAGRVLLANYNEPDVIMKLFGLGEVVFLKMKGYEPVKEKVPCGKDFVSLESFSKAFKSMDCANIYYFDKQWLYFVASSKSFVPVRELLPADY